jgi:hypothetical protein
MQLSQQRPRKNASQFIRTTVATVKCRHIDRSPRPKSHRRNRQLLAFPSTRVGSNGNASSLCRHAVDSNGNASTTRQTSQTARNRHGQVDQCCQSERSPRGSASSAKHAAPIVPCKPNQRERPSELKGRDDPRNRRVQLNFLVKINTDRGFSSFRRFRPTSCG